MIAPMFNVQQQDPVFDFQVPKTCPEVQETVISEWLPESNELGSLLFYYPPYTEITYIRRIICLLRTIARNYGQGAATGTHGVLVGGSMIGSVGLGIGVHVGEASLGALVEVEVGDRVAVTVAVFAGVLVEVGCAIGVFVGDLEGATI